MVEVTTHDELARETWGCVLKLFMSPEVHERMHEACVRAGLPHPGALKALTWLRADEPPSMRAMAEALHCDASYVTALVDNLEELGYVERRVSPSDRRVKRLHLTRAGVAAQGRAFDLMHTPPKGFDLLSATEVRTLCRLLGKAAQGYSP